MSILNSNFSAILKNNSIIFMPSCILVEMVTEVYARVAALTPARMAEGEFADIIGLLERLAGNFSAAAEAVEKANLQFFAGDWRDDCLRVRTLYLNLTSRLWFLGGGLNAAERDMFRQNMDAMHTEWVALVNTLEWRDRENPSGDERCRHFRSVHPSRWQQIMARIILSLDARATERRPGTFLMLLCFQRIRSQIMGEIDKLQKEATTHSEFRAEDILCLSSEYLPITCPKCRMTTETFRRADPIDSILWDTFHEQERPAPFGREAARASVSVADPAQSTALPPVLIPALASGRNECHETINFARGGAIRNIPVEAGR